MGTLIRAAQDFTFLIVSGHFSDHINLALTFGKSVRVATISTIRKKFSYKKDDNTLPDPGTAQVSF